MNRKILLRIAAVFVLIHLLGHTMGHLAWDKPEALPMQEVVKSMKSNEAEFMGATRSMADYYHGYSIILFGLYGMSILILWVLSGSEENVKTTKTISGILGVTYLFFAVIEGIYFFPFAASISGLAGVTTLLSVFTAKK